MTTDLEARARDLQPGTGELAACWALVIAGVRYHLLDADELADLVEALGRGEDRILEALAFEHLGGRLRVRLHDEAHRCDPADMLRLLAALRRAAER